MIQLYDMGKNLNEPRMTPIQTDQGRKEGIESASICAICGSKQRDLREEKALAGSDPTGHTEPYPVGAINSARSSVAHSMIGLYVRQKE